MAQSSGDIRVIFRPEGVKGVIDGLRLIRREAEALQKAGTSAGPGLGGGSFVNLFDKATPAAGGLDKALSGILATAQRLIPVLGFVGATTALVGIGRNALETASNVSKLRQQFTLTSEDLTALQFTARTNEATNEDLSRGLQNLAKSQRELRAGTDEVVEAYADLGLTARDFQGLNLAQSLEVIGKAMKGIDPTRLNLDVILGRNSRELIPTLNELADKGLAGVRKEAEKAGAVLSSEMTAALKKSADESQLLKEKVDGLGNSFIATFGPVLRKATEGATTFFDTIRAAATGDVFGVFRAQILGFRKFIGLDKDAPATAKPRVPGGPGAEVQRQIAEASKRQSEETLKALSEENRRRRELAEASIEGERKIVEARVAGNSNQIQASRDLLDADTRAQGARIQLAQDTARTETDIARARFQSELQLAQQQSASDAGFAARRVSIDRAFSQERQRIAQGLFQELKRLEADALAQVKSSREQQKALENELRDIRRSAADLAFEGGIAGAGPATQEIERTKRAEENILALKAAAGKGDIERARQLRAEIEGQARAIAGLDTAFAGDSGKRVLDEANAVFEQVAAKAQAIEKEREQAGLRAVASLQTQIAEVQKLITDVSSKPIPIRLGLAESETQNIIRQIQEQLGRTPFQIAVTPVVQGGGAPGFASGGRLGGRSPGPRADNLLFAGTAGEYVQPVAAVRKYGLGFMEAIRTRTLPRFADGGQLGGAPTAAAGGTVEHFINIGGRRIGPIWAQQDRVTELVDELQRQLAG